MTDGPFADLRLIDRQGRHRCGVSRCATCWRLERANAREKQAAMLWEMACRERREARAAWVDHIVAIAEEAA